MNNVFIIPQMFSLSNKSQIIQNINFYQDTIELINQKIIRVCVYPEMYSLLQEPIRLESIQDPGLKEECKLINRLFVGKILNERYEVDIEECGGTQDFKVSEAFISDKAIYGISQYLLINCYTDLVGKERIDNRILCGKKGNGELLYSGDLFISCACEQRGPISHQFMFCWPHDLFDKKTYAITVLRDKCFRKVYSFNSSPELVLDGDHHVYFQDSTPNCFDDLSRANKSVLRILQSFGLSRLHIHDTHGGSWGSPGEIKVDEEFAPSDSKTCVTGSLRGENNTVVTIELQFPEGIGALIVDAIGRNWNTRNLKKLKQIVIP